MVVVVVLKLGECGLQLGAAHEEFAGEQLVSELAEEANGVAILPGFARLDESIGHALGKGHGAKLGTVVADDRQRPAVNEEQPFELSLDFESGKGTCRLEQKALPREAVQDAEYPRVAAILKPLVAEVQAPRLVRPTEHRPLGPRIGRASGACGGELPGPPPSRCGEPP